MPRLPPVDISPQTRLRARFSPGVIDSVATFFQSHSSSSATSWARPVSVPCPISERAMRITQVSSGLISTQALTSVPASCASAGGKPKGRWKPSARPPPAAAEPTMNVRRESLVRVFFTADLRALAKLEGGLGGLDRAAAGRPRRQVHGRPDALIGSAPADVGHRL